MNEQIIRVEAPVLSISERQSNGIYQSITMRMFSTQPNKNKEAVTEAFISEIADNEKKYVGGVHLYADVSKLANKDYKGLGHLLDKRTGKFYTQMIGSFGAFYKQNDEFGVSLIGEARVSKKNKEVCDALAEMYEQGNLNFSFEIKAGETRKEGEILIIDASEKNELIGMAVVSIPAYPEAKALALVAEVESVSAFENAKIEIADIDFETLRMWLWQAVQQWVGEEESWYIHFEKVGPDSAIFYSYKTGQTFKIEFVVQNDSLVIKDVYEVIYVRKESENEMTLEQAQAKIEELEAQAKVDTDKIAQLEADKAALDTAKVALEGEKTSLAQEKETLTQEKATLISEKTTLEAKETELNSQIETLKAEKAELEPFKAQAETLKAEQEKAESDKKKAEAKKFAETMKLDVADKKIADAIEAMDYQALSAAALVIAEAEKDKPAEFVAVFTSSMKTSGGSNAFGGIFDPVEKK